MPPKRSRRQKTSAEAALYRVFVSHATADKWIARTICEKIDAIAGATTFRDDRDIEGGDPISTVLRDELERADELLVVLTPTSIARQWVLAEIAMAFAFRKRIVPVCYNVAADQIPIVPTNRAYPLNDFDNYLGDLGRRVGKGRT